MAKVLQRLTEKRKREVKVLITGLNAAGKSTIVSYLKYGKSIPQLPTVGYAVQSIEWNDLKFVMRDFSGKNRKSLLSEQLQEFYQNVEVLIFVVDSKDSERLMKCKEELWSLFDVDAIREVVVLIMANKQDLQGALSVEEIRQTLEIDGVFHRDIRVQGTCALNGQGLNEGLMWIREKLMDYDELRRSPFPY